MSLVPAPPETEAAVLFDGGGLVVTLDGCDFVFPVDAEELVASPDDGGGGSGVTLEGCDVVFPPVEEVLVLPPDGCEFELPPDDERLLLLPDGAGSVEFCGVELFCDGGEGGLPPGTGRGWGVDPSPI